MWISNPFKLGSPAMSYNVESCGIYRILIGRFNRGSNR